MASASARGRAERLPGELVKLASDPVRAEIEALDSDRFAAAIPDLAALLVDAVEGGAAVNFVAGVTPDEARAWWSARIPQVADGTITAFVARQSNVGGKADRPALIGSTLLIRSPNPNSPHRAEIAKVLVHRSARRQGLGRALMEAAETRARSDGRWLLLLDTQTGTDAEAFYRSLGWQELGTMPNHSLTTDGLFAPTTFFWKDLRS
jgi:GNAT superfamily N-acetyltransferase